MRDVSNLRIGEPDFTSQVIFIGSIFINFLAIRIVILSLIVCKIWNLFFFPLDLISKVLRDEDLNLNTQFSFLYFLYFRTRK